MKMHLTRKDVRVLAASVLPASELRAIAAMTVEERRELMQSGGEAWEMLVAKGSPHAPEPSPTDSVRALRPVLAGMGFEEAVRLLIGSQSGTDRDSE